ncbi:histidine kinase [Phlyctema vagabunda]|uniref:histidine kinase n=1 Tax=Phlyctema vagabunda TaxID=108571 RepID=A0ABR4P6C2_9HELO
MNSSLAGHYFRTRLEQESRRRSLQNVCKTKLGNDILHIICDIQDEDWVVSTQVGVWTRIIMNLFGNSMKYTPSGFIRVTLELKENTLPSSDNEDSEIVLCVEDSGQGISEAFLTNNLYKPFHQEDVLRPGTGLGLSIVKQLVHSINGTVKVKSTVGQGTTFIIAAKVTRPLQTDHWTLQETRNVEVPTEIHGFRVGILGFDLPIESIESTTSTGSTLNRRNQATKASFEAILKRLRLAPTTVLSHDSDNIDVLLTTEEHYNCAIRDSQITRKIPIIILNSSLSLDYRDATHDGGPLVYLSQPFNRTRLVKALKSCLSYYNSLTDEVRETRVVEAIPTDTQADRFDAKKTEMLPSVNKFPTTTDDTTPGSPRILLVEDNAINLKLLVAFMRKLKCPFATASDGQEAVDAYRANDGQFHAIFMDIQMPNKDGMTASTEIRAYEKETSRPRTLIIAITGLASLEVHRQAAQCGVDSLLTKPVSLKSLKGIIEGISGG